MQVGMYALAIVAVIGTILWVLNTPIGQDVSGCSRLDVCDPLPDVGNR